MVSELDRRPSNGFDPEEDSGWSATSDRMKDRVGERVIDKTNTVKLPRDKMTITCRQQPEQIAPAAIFMSGATNRSNAQRSV